MTGYRFVVRGADSLDFPLRLINLFAQRDLPLECLTVSRQAGQYLVAIEHHGLLPATAQVILEKMRMMVLVESVEMHPLSLRQECAGRVQEATMPRDKAACL